MQSNSSRIHSSIVWIGANLSIHSSPNIPLEAEWPKYSSRLYIGRAAGAPRPARPSGLRPPT